MAIAYRSEIDGLRAIAVTAVVLYHAGAHPAAGFVGVDVFFTISGYLITALLVQEYSCSGRIDFFAFYARRVRRIFPAAAVLVLVVLGIAYQLLPSADLAHTAKSASAAALFCANFFFQATTGGYFDAAAEAMPLLHLWSLAVEEQFYLVWPLLLLALLRQQRVSLLPILVALGLASLGLAEWLMGSNVEAAFYQMPARFWELAAGGAVAITAKGQPLPKWIANASFTGILATCFVPITHFYHPFPRCWRPSNSRVFSGLASMCPPQRQPWAGWSLAAIKTDGRTGSDLILAVSLALAAVGFLSGNQYR